MKNLLLIGVIIVIFLSGCQKDEVKYSAWNKYFELPNKYTSRSEEKLDYDLLNVSNNIFILGNYHEDFWQFDVENKELIEKKIPPSLYTRYPTNTFVVDKECFICFQYYDSLILYNYDSYTNKWYPKKGVSLDFLLGDVQIRSFTTHDKAYVIIQSVELISYGGPNYGTISHEDYYYQFWCYNILTDEWEKLTDYPKYFKPTFFTFQNRYFLAFGKSEYGTTNKVWEYFPETNEWYERSPFPGTDRYGAVSFISNNKIYCGLGYSKSIEGYTNDFWEYNINSDTWEQVGGFENADSKTSESFVVDTTNYIIVNEGIWKFNGWE